MTAQGVYTLTVTATGYDGNTNSADIAIAVLDKAKLDALLQAKWAGIEVTYYVYFQQDDNGKWKIYTS